MVKKYTFVCEEILEGNSPTTTIVSFTNEHDCWKGYDGPVAKMLDFLQGIGFVFDMEDRIGVMKKDGEFIDAGEPNVWQ